MPCNLTLNPLYFQVIYHVNGKASPAYQVFPGISNPSPFNPSPFNSELTPFLIPAAAESFGFNAQADSAPGSDPVFWQVTIRFFQPPPSNAIIVSPGDPAKNIAPFSFRTGDVTPIVNPGQHGQAGFTPVNVNDIYRYHPKDLPLNTPVRLEITLSAFSDSAFTKPATDTDPSTNVLNFWLMRV